MKWRVMLYVSGVVFNVDVIATNLIDARKTALAMNPTARYISATRIF